MIRFGRAGPDEGVDLQLSDDPRLHRHAGYISILPAGWQLTNTGSRLHLLVADLHGFGRDDLPPGVCRTVPWQHSSVTVPLGSEQLTFTVECRTTPADDDSDDPAIDNSGPPTIEPFAIDRSTGYFRTLVALCEPQLLDPRSGHVPSDAALAVRLNRCHLESRHLTARSVERRLNYLRRALAIREEDDTGSAVGLERRDGRRQLVELALATGLVSSADLSALCPTAEPTGDQ